MFLRNSLKSDGFRSQAFKKNLGSGMVQLCTLTFAGMLVSSIAVDFGITYSAQSAMQTSADAAALASAATLMHSTSSDVNTNHDEAKSAAEDYAAENMGENFATVNDDDVVLGYIDPTDPDYDKTTFTSPSNADDYSQTGGYNAVWVRVKPSADDGVPTIASKLFGVSKTQASAYAVAYLDSDIGAMTGGLRPIYGCVEQYNLDMADGTLGDETIRVYGDKFQFDGSDINSGCPAPGAGNWGFADLRDSSPGAPGNNTLSRWWEEGYGGGSGETNPITAGSYYSTQPGNSINSNGVTTALENLKNNETVITIPLINTDYTGNGSNTKVKVVGFIGMVITDYSAQGNNSWIQGRLTRVLCTTNCTSGNATGFEGLTAAKLKLIH